MTALLVVIFLVIPIIELALIIQVGQAVGVLNTIGLLLLVSFVGAWLVKREGLEVWERFRRQVDRGVVPARELADGVMIIFAGALLMTPGFVTDLLGLSLLLPPVRAAIRASTLARITRRIRYH